MQNFLTRLRAFMAGRYGFDQLGGFLFGLSMVFWLLCVPLRWMQLPRVYFVFWALNTGLYIIALFRIFSRNTYRRTVENERYLRLRGRILPFLQRQREKHGDPDYFFKNCPFCGTKLRLRRVRGRHTSKCPKCRKKFTVRVLRGGKN